MLRTLLAICLLSATAQSQTITGLLTGSLRDSSGQAVADAEVILTNQANGARVQTATDSVGNFTITGLQPATYAIAVGKSGFKRLERGTSVVTAGERRTVGELTLELGAVTETVNVTSQAANIPADPNMPSDNSILAPGAWDNIKNIGAAAKAKIGAALFA